MLIPTLFLPQRNIMSDLPSQKKKRKKNQYSTATPLSYY